MILKQCMLYHWWYTAKGHMVHAEDRVMVGWKLNKVNITNNIIIVTDLILGI